MLISILFSSLREKVGKQSKMILESQKADFIFQEAFDDYNGTIQVNEWFSYVHKPLARLQFSLAQYFRPLVKVANSLISSPHNETFLSLYSKHLPPSTLRPPYQSNIFTVSSFSRATIILLWCESASLGAFETETL